MQCHLRPEEGIGSSVIGVTDNCGHIGPGEMNLGPLEGQPVLLVTPAPLSLILNHWEEFFISILKQRKK